MKTTTLLIALLTCISLTTSAQVTISAGLLKSEIKPRTSPPPPLPPPAPADSNQVNVNIWPSPALEDFNLLIRTPLKEKIEVQVFDLSGREVLSFEALDQISQSFGRTFEPGLYFVLLKQEPVFEETFKVVKQ